MNDSMFFGFVLVLSSIIGAMGFGIEQFERRIPNILEIVHPLDLILPDPVVPETPTELTVTVAQHS